MKIAIQYNIYPKYLDRQARANSADPGPEVIKLNWAEHEICLANKSQISNNCKFFLAKHSWAFSANKYENLLEEKISCSAKLSVKIYIEWYANMLKFFAEKYE